MNPAAMPVRTPENPAMTPVRSGVRWFTSIHHNRSRPRTSLGLGIPDPSSDWRRTVATVASASRCRRDLSRGFIGQDGSADLGKRCHRSTDEQVFKGVLVTVPVLLVLPLVAMLGLMSVGAATGAGVLSNMNGSMNRSAGSMAMSGGMMGVGLVWMVLVAAALVFLLVFLVRGTTRR
jgi:hypothetical protein